MGSHIHGFLEVKLKGEWYVYDCIELGLPNTTLVYELWWLMTGSKKIESYLKKFRGVVVAEGKPIANRLEIPSDASKIVKAEIKAMRHGISDESFDNSCAFTWLSLDEIEKVVEELHKLTHKKSMAKIYRQYDIISTPPADISAVLRSRCEQCAPYIELDIKGTHATELAEVYEDVRGIFFLI